MQQSDASRVRMAQVDRNAVGDGDCEQQTGRGRDVAVDSVRDSPPPYRALMLVDGRAVNLPTHGERRELRPMDRFKRQPVLHDGTSAPIREQAKVYPALPA